MLFTRLSFSLFLLNEPTQEFINLAKISLYVCQCVCFVYVFLFCFSLGGMVMNFCGCSMKISERPIFPIISWCHTVFVLCTDVNECLQSPCMNGATCVNTVGSFYCTCYEGWTGPYCAEGKCTYMFFVLCKCLILLLELTFYLVCHTFHPQCCRTAWCNSGTMLLYNNAIFHTVLQ